MRLLELDPADAERTRRRTSAVAGGLIGSVVLAWMVVVDLAASLFALLWVLDAMGVPPQL
jgi:hypothetical protein